MNDRPVTDRIHKKARSSPGRLAAALGLVFVLFGCEAMAYDPPRIRLDLTLGFYTLFGNYESSSQDSFIPSVDLGDDLGIGGLSAAPGAQFEFRFAQNHAITLAGFTVSDQGSATTEIPFAIGGNPVNIEAEMSSDFKLTSLSLAYTYFPVSHDNVELGLFAGFERLEADATVRLEDTLLHLVSVTRQDNRQETGLILGLVARGRLSSRFRLDSRAAYARLPLSSSDISFLDLALAGTFEITDHLGARAGVRYQKTTVEGDGYDLSLGADGPFVGLSILY